MNAIYRYLLILTGCAALLLGIQVPSFVDQYGKRLDAHLSEAANNLAGYQTIADKFFGGSIGALIAKHEQSPDQTFREEARPIRNIFERYRRFTEEKAALAAALPGQLFHIVAAGDRQLLDETLAGYSYTVPLNRSAVYSGLICAAASISLIELLSIALLKMLGVGRRAAERG